MADTWVTDLTHYLDATGELGHLPVPALNLALHQGAIVEWMTSRQVRGIERTNVYCRRSPNRQRCRGQINAQFDPRSRAIAWQCPICGDGGYIYSWEGTRWDRGQH